MEKCSESWKFINEVKGGKKTNNSIKMIETLE